MKKIYIDKITREDMKLHPNWLYLFGDNLEKVGMGGQAGEMRGEPNAQGIPTKIRPSMDSDAFFSDDMFGQIKKFYDELFIIILAAFRAGKFEMLVIPSAGIGTGLARLKEKAPKIYEYLLLKLNELGE